MSTSAETASPPARGQRWRWLLVPLFYTVLALTLAWPLPLYLGSRVQHGGDAMQYIWNLWWFRQALEQGTNPFHTSMLYHPYGVSMAFSTLVPLESAATIPLQWLGVSLIACYNILTLASSIIGAWTMYALARRLTGSAPAALLAGIIYGWAPYHSAHLMGHLNLASQQWLPLFALALMRTVDGLLPQAEEEGWRAGEERRRPWLWAALAGLAAAAVALTEMTYAVLMLLWAVLYVLYRAWPTLRAWRWRALGQLLGALALTSALAALLAMPLLLPMIHELRTADYMVMDPGETLLYSADAAFYLLPSELHPIAGPRIKAVAEGRVGGNPAERVITPGYTALGLAFVGLLLCWRLRGVRFWGWAVISFGILSLGPILRLLGRTEWTVFRGNVLLPYAVLYYVPGLSAMRTPSRFAVVVLLGVAVLAAYGLAEVLRRWGRRGQTVAAVATILVLFEVWTSPPLVPLSDYAVSELMKSDQQQGAVLDLPLRPMVDYLWYQTRHGRPMIGGHLSRQPPDRFMEENPALIYLQPSTPITATASITGGAGLRSLLDSDVRYLVVHWWATDDQREPLRYKLDLLLGDLQPLVQPDAAISVYRLE